MLVHYDSIKVLTTLDELSSSYLAQINKLITRKQDQDADRELVNKDKLMIITSQIEKKQAIVYKYNCPISDYFGFLILCKKIHR